MRDKWILNYISVVNLTSFCVGLALGCREVQKMRCCCVGLGQILKFGVGVGFSTSVGPNPTQRYWGVVVFFAPMRPTPTQRYRGVGLFSSQYPNANPTPLGRWGIFTKMTRPTQWPNPTPLGCWGIFTKKIRPNNQTMLLSINCVTQ